MGKLVKGTRKASLDLLKAALDAVETTDHCVSVEFFGHSDSICVAVMLGGFVSRKQYDYFKIIGRSNVSEVVKATDYIKSLIANSPAAETARETE